MNLKLPELGEGVHEGELVKWLVKVGDSVKDDQPVCEIMTDKATVELPSPFHGKVTALMAKEGETVKVGQDILAYDGGGAASAGAPQASGAGAPQASGAGAPQASGAGAPTTAKPAAHAPAAAAPTPAAARGGVNPPTGVTSGLAAASQATGPVAAAPSTRRYAREAGIDLATVQGSGPAGRVMREDVERFISGGGNGAARSTGTGATSAGQPKLALRTRAALPAGQQEERVPFKGLRKKISEKMRQSKDHAAHFTYVEEADATELVALRKQAKEVGEKYGVKVTFLPFLMKAMVAALRQYPILNTSLDEEKGEIVYKHYYNIALSVQTDDGLTAPVIKNVDQKSVLEIAKEIAEVVDRARHKKLTMDDLTGGTITLTNVGSIGGLFATPVINYPEVAIVGFNKIFRKPVVVKRKAAGEASFAGGAPDEEIAIRDWTYLSISLDHRVVDGAIGAEFMKAMIRYIENPALLTLEG